MNIVIDAEIEKETLEQLENGAGKDYPLERSFIKTVGGYIDMTEVLLLIYNKLKKENKKQFRLTIEVIDVGDIKPDGIRAAFMSDAIQGV